MRLHCKLVAVLAFLSLDGLCFADAAFQSGKPVWPAGREKEKNLLAGFRAVFTAGQRERPLLRVTASSLYRAFLNGEFLGHGPARGPHGYFRVDEWDLTEKIQPGRNLVAIEVAGYNVNSYYLLDQPSFVQAEVVAGGEVLASTSGAGQGFEARVLEERLQKVQRYSFQRTFSEVYSLRPDYADWRRNPDASFAPVQCSILAARKLLPRGVPYPHFVKRRPMRVVSTGRIRTGVEPAHIWRDRALTQIGPKLGGFKEEELQANPSLELQRTASVEESRAGRALAAPASLKLEEKSYQIVDFGTNLTGFLGGQVRCSTRARLYFVFDEILSKGDVDFKRLSTVNIVALEMEPGRYEFETIEPYTLRYLKLMALEGSCETEEVYLREYVNPNVWRAHFASSDQRLNRLFAAGRETFRQNAVDIFMDCPSRERAGWLCDSFFTARVAPDLGGDTRIERNFFENYLLPEHFASLPTCMLPMCYPADHVDGRFIPNWALWFVVELEEYVGRSGDGEMAKALQPKVLCLLDYFEKFRNEDGLLEKLPSWVFIEWSDANKFTQDVNYPSNMLYAAALAAAGRIYEKPELLLEAQRVREAVRRQSFDGQFFVDNAVRKSGKLEVTRNRSEVCQYFAFFFDTATPQTHPKLWDVLRERFGPDRARTGAFSEIHPANSFVGNMLRLELLSRYGLTQQLLDESISYLLYMADRTGTLWENTTPTASCNHGFASHIVHTLYRDVLGLYRVDPILKAVEIRFSDLRLDWCEGVIPVRDGRIALQWRVDGNRILYRADVPAGYAIAVENRSGKQLIPEY